MAGIEGPERSHSGGYGHSFWKTRTIHCVDQYGQNIETLWTIINTELGIYRFHYLIKLNYFVNV